MSGKNQKKLRQLVRRNELKLVDASWDVFFDVISKMDKKSRKKIAKLIKKGIDFRAYLKQQGN